MKQWKLSKQRTSHPTKQQLLTKPHCRAQCWAEASDQHDAVSSLCSQIFYSNTVGTITWLLFNVHQGAGSTLALFWLHRAGLVQNLLLQVLLQQFGTRTHESKSIGLHLFNHRAVPEEKGKVKSTSSIKLLQCL